MNDKISFFGEFNNGKGALERALKVITDLWNNGEIRLKSDDIEDITKTEREIRGLLSQISGFKKLFQDIANNKKDKFPEID